MSPHGQCSVKCREAYWNLILGEKQESEVTQSCTILCDPMDCSLPGSSIHGIFQARVLSGLPFPPPMNESEKWSRSVAQSCPTLGDPTDSSPPGFPIPGIVQARTLEWVAIPLSNAWKWKVKVKLLSRVWLLATPWIAAYQAPPPMGFSRQKCWSGVPLPSPIITWMTCINFLKIIL